MVAKTILETVMVLLPMILSLTVHEYAHAWMAKRLGDDTAEGQGRLNLNPLSHIDTMGTIILPAFLVFSGSGFFFGWAKPVPVNPTRFRSGVDLRRGMMWTAAAGPLSNLVLAFLAQGGLALFLFFGVAAPAAGLALMERMVIINVALALFNMIPVYPLDGQKVVSGFLPHDLALRFERFNIRYGSTLLLLLLLFGGRVIAPPMFMILELLGAIFGLA